ncbi:MAG: 4a-hydroxytetrahydrobiopterin dehydratase [Moraxellaceae bacterium]|nr:4a-hydroxytetrahydrobiopterin dehydratase [Moraxellaceae bacterium]
MSTPRALLEAEARTQLALHALQGWQLLPENGIRRLLKTYPTANFVQALALAQRVGWLAEREQHHPELTVAWGRLTVAWWTTAVSGLTDQDFRMAAATDEILYNGKPLA